MIYTCTTIVGRRDVNEDSHNVIINLNGQEPNKTNVNLFGIYDGHGGNIISKYLKKIIPKLYYDTKRNTPFKKSLHNKIFNHIQNKILESKYGFTMGSTCLLCFFYNYNNKLYLNTVNLGDCRAVLIYDDNTVKAITTDHKPDEINERIRIKKLGGKIYKDRDNTYRIGDLSVSKSFGDGDNYPFISQEPDIFYDVITDKCKYLVMACDGFWDVIKNEELPQLIKNCNEKYLSVYLTNIALKKGTDDNISIIVIQF